MSPAKRLSRQRFRALCERCETYRRHYTEVRPYGSERRPTTNVRRVGRWAHRVMMSARTWNAACDAIEAHARLTR